MYLESGEMSTTFEYELKQFTDHGDGKLSQEASQLYWLPGSQPPAVIGVDGMTFYLQEKPITNLDDEVLGWTYMCNPRWGNFGVIIWND